MRALLVALIAIAACTRSAPAPAPAPDAKALLEGCTREMHEGATVWSCGEAFLVMEAPVPAPITDASIESNLGAFETDLGGSVVSRDRADFTVDGAPHRATRIRVDLPEKGRFFAMMIVVREPGGTKARALSCSAKEAEAYRCEQVIGALARQRPAS